MLTDSQIILSGDFMALYTDLRYGVVFGCSCYASRYNSWVSVSLRWLPFFLQTCLLTSQKIIKDVGELQIQPEIAEKQSWIDPLVFVAWLLRKKPEQAEQNFQKIVRAGAGSGVLSFLKNDETDG